MIAFAKFRSAFQRRLSDLVRLCVRIVVKGLYWLRPIQVPEEMSKDNPLFNLVLAIYLVLIVTIFTQLFHRPEDPHLSYFPFPRPLYKIDNIDVSILHSLQTPCKSPK
jgi:hypothetical protein